MSATKQLRISESSYKFARTEAGRLGLKMNEVGDHLIKQIKNSRRNKK